MNVRRSWKKKKNEIRGMGKMKISKYELIVILIVTFIIGVFIGVMFNRKTLIPRKQAKIKNLHELHKDDFFKKEPTDEVINMILTRRLKNAGEIKPIGEYYILHIDNFHKIYALIDSHDKWVKISINLWENYGDFRLLDKIYLDEIWVEKSDMFLYRDFEMYNSVREKIRKRNHHE